MSQQPNRRQIVLQYQVRTSKPGLQAIARVMRLLGELQNAGIADLRQNDPAFATIARRLAESVIKRVNDACYRAFTVPGSGLPHTRPPRQSIIEDRARWVTRKRPDGRTKRRFRWRGKPSRKYLQTVAQLRRVEHKRVKSMRGAEHRITTTIVRQHQLIAIANTAIRNLTKSAKGTLENPGRNIAPKRRLNQAILAQRWYAIREQLEYKARWYGRDFVAVPAPYTSQTCPACGHREAGNRPERSRFICRQCGTPADADVIGGENIRRLGVIARAGAENPALPPAPVNRRTRQGSKQHTPAARLPLLLFTKRDTFSEFSNEQSKAVRTPGRSPGNQAGHLQPGPEVHRNRRSQPGSAAAASRRGDRASQHTGAGIRPANQEPQRTPAPTGPTTRRATMNAKPPTSLQALLDTLEQTRPAAITALLVIVNDYQGYRWLEDVVQAVLPDRREHIFRDYDHAGTIARFRTEFENRYFPLLDDIMELAAESDVLYSDDHWATLMQEVPIALHGFLLEDAHQLAEWLEPHHYYLEMALTPLLLPVSSISYEDDPNIRVSWLEAAARVVDRATLSQIPPEGFDPAAAVAALSADEYGDLRNLVQWTLRETDHEILNIQYGPDEYICPEIPWDPDCIQETAAAWRAAQPTLESVHRALDWLGKDPRKHFAQVVELIVQHQPAP